MLSLVVAVGSFVLPGNLAAARPNTSSRASTLQAIELPFIGKIGIDFGGGDKLQLFPSDVQFTDVDGDTVTLRPAGGTRVDFYVGSKLMMRNAGLVRNGNTLEITGKQRKDFGGIVLLGFELEEIVTEGTTPRDPTDLDKAMALVE
jgi:hypothetical protein